jgi:hypothetical protein
MATAARPWFPLAAHRLPETYNDLLPVLAADGGGIDFVDATADRPRVLWREPVRR